MQALSTRTSDCSTSVSDCTCHHQPFNEMLDMLQGWHFARNCNNLGNFDYVDGTVVNNNNYNDNVDDSWCLDTGASHHMTPTTDRMTDVAPYEGNMSIIIEEENILKVTHIGNIWLKVLVSFI